ncbi:MAG: PD-(D/E)XK nuclease-like domain-containing protein [Candidatus Micrarchaeota archaeon]|nr:PD-(D/E)XK nuclease-like domain-containing protein [Candidatus Micrarchaeota archaeon]
MTPGVHHALPMAEYLKLPAVSASLISDVIERCPAAAWFNSWMNPAGVADNTDLSDRGTIAHSILLEDRLEIVVVIDPLDHPAEKTGSIPDGWTNKSIRAARDAAREAGKIPVLKPAMAEIDAMVIAARAFIASLRQTEPAIYAMFQKGGGHSELTMVWDEDGILCKARPDRIAADHSIIVNYKTTTGSVEPDRWGRTQLLDYYVGAAWYQRGMQALNGNDPAYLFLCQEQNAPYLCSLVGISPEMLEVGHAKCRAGLKRWKECFARNEWPGYPARACYPEMPIWERARWDERQLNDPTIAYASQA